MRLFDVLPAADVMVAICRLAAARSRGLSFLQLFKERDRKKDWPRADHRTLVDADGLGIFLVGNRLADDPA